METTQPLTSGVNMAATLTTTARPTCKPARKGFGSLPCPLCNEESGIMLDITCVSETEDCLSCRSCEAEFSLSAVRKVVAAWTAALAWIDAMPTID